MLRADLWWLYSAAKAVKRALLPRRLAAGGDRRRLLQGAGACVVPPVLFRMPRLDPFLPDPQLHPLRRQPAQPATALREANGAPLSVRMAPGSPYSRNMCFAHARTVPPSVFPTARQRSR